MRTFDVVVVGAGPAGENVAGRVVAAGLSAVVVEAELVGGECSYWACMPSKALLRSVHALRAARRVPGAREAVTGDLDVAAVLRRRDDFISHLHDDGQVQWLEGAGIELVRGRGRLTGEREVTVETAKGPVVIRAEQAVVIATGTTAAVPDLPGLRAASPWTSREVTNADHAPRRLVVLGGGVVALEMAQAWKALGSEEVTVLERGDQLLPRLEPFVGELVGDALREDGIDLRTGTSVESVERAVERGEVAVHLSDGSTLLADELLVAAGRRPATSDVGLEKVGLEPGGWIEVDDSLRGKGSDWLYAVGDANGRVLLTHQGKYQARVASDAIVARAKGLEPPYLAEADDLAVPQVIFTDPEVAAVGLSGAAARTRGLRVRVVEYAIGDVAGGSLQAEGYRGRAAIVVDEDAGVLVGATFVGQDVAELVHAATIAIVGRVPIERLRHAVPSYPTMSEVWLRLLEAYGQ